MLHIEGLKEDGEEIPNPTTETMTMDIPNLA
jgi:predicted RNase H-like HicB family nuclease